MEEEVEKTKKKSFWKDKKNWLIIFLIFMVFVCAGSSDTENVSSNAVSTNTVSAVSGDELNQVRNELNTANSKLEEAENTIKYLSGELENTVVEKGEYENKVQSLTTEKNELEDKVEELEEENEKLKTAVSKSSSAKTTSTTSTATTKAATPTQSSNSYTVYITKTGSKYHRDGCSYLKSKIAIDKNSAISSGYSACSRCNP